ncbi:hypothetical protein BGAL_0432g00030 [Botrytis galanthina]|uniref:Uncharacterized protein n=1 Tax=Botrytis galanthina TaxID=278940 RepID=A0A4V4HTK9_9HELO|nr:hypothetical protein BGAL_0432g00030 [Botrytis galanthina]
MMERNMGVGEQQHTLAESEEGQVDEGTVYSPSHRNAGLEVSGRIIYHAQTEYSGPNETLVDQIWSSIDTSPGAIAISLEYAANNDVLTSLDTFPWDGKKGIVFVRGFHDLHCLKLIKRSLSEYRDGNPQTKSRAHISHCVDTLRQGVLCSADDTPMPTDDGTTGDGQPLQCRIWDKLVKKGGRVDTYFTMRIIPKSPIDLQQRGTPVPQQLLNNQTQFFA